MSDRAARRVVVLCALLGAATFTAAPAAADGQGAPREAPPQAEQPSPSGLRLALRSGLARPLGQAFTASGSLTDTISGYVPFRLDVGYRFASHFYVGALAQIAPILPSGCPSGSSCTGTDVRVGAMIAYHLLPSRLVDPWLGLGVGYESLSVSRTVEGSSVDIAARGFELLDVELGVDLRPSPSLRLGPVLSTSVATFNHVAINGTPTSDFDTSTHAWVMLGFRGAYDL